jgi:transposase
MSNKKKRRRYTKEFKLEAVQLVEARDGNASEVARKLGIRPDLVNRWKREYNADKKHSFPGLGKLKEPEEEMRKLCKELADTKMERDILKKALAIFSKPSP